MHNVGSSMYTVIRLMILALGIGFCLFVAYQFAVLAYWFAKGIVGWLKSKRG